MFEIPGLIRRDSELPVHVREARAAGASGSKRHQLIVLVLAGLVDLCPSAIARTLHVDPSGDYPLAVYLLWLD